MSPHTDSQESQATKRKRELDEQGRRKRSKQDKHAKQKLADAQNTRPDSAAQANGDAAPEQQPRPRDEGILTKQKRQPRPKKKGLATVDQSATSIWKVSQPMGGRILNIDPLLTTDEKHLILAYNTSLQVYSAADSLLVRKIQLPLDRREAYSEQIMAICLSPISNDHLWVASSSGRLWRIDWTTGNGAEPLFNLDCLFLSGLAVERVKFGKIVQEVPFACIGDELSWRIVACNVQGGQFKSSKTLMEHDAVVQKVQAVKNGSAIAASADSDIIVGHLKSGLSTFEELSYEFFVLDCSDEITCLDVRATERIHLSRASQSKTGDEPVVDVVVGCARGSVFYYNDLLPQLRHLQTAKKARNLSLQPRKSHWHRRAVHAVKWSRDGNYVISGGSEQTLVLWQLDTGKLDFLPHLSATIENIVVSSRGSSYVIHLDDNSAMILSTAEMKPTTYVSGVQTHLVPPPFSKDELVHRVGQKITDEVVRIPSAVNPTNTSRLLMCVGNGQHNPATPMIQTVDLSTIQSVSKQALTRTNPTDINVTPKGFPIVEPHVTSVAFSFDGKWLATTDEWEPPVYNVDPTKVASSTPDQREVYLKIWSVTPEDNSLELLARINNPHSTTRGEPVLGLASDPTSHRFATIGSDGFVRTWRPIVRQRDGVLVKGKQGRQLHSWTCSQSVAIYENDGSDSQDVAAKSSGAVCFSQDGSILVTAYSTPVSSAIHIIDAETGEVRNVVYHLIEGGVQGIEIVGSQLVVLSDILAVYDLVSDELTYGMQLRREEQQLGPAVLSHLAVDHATSSFAVAVSRRKLEATSVQTELAIFSSDKSEPELLQRFPQPIAAVIPTLGAGGFIVVDVAAQLWSVSQGRDTQSAFAQPLADLNLDNVSEETGPTKSTAIVMEVDADDASDDEMDVDIPEASDLDDDLHPAVIAPQRLAELFDSAPAFAMPPIEDMFYQVTKLFSTKKPAAVV
ncbi:NET1-associated nuclear protein 1 (U3 small nucleolar RNA-associated protein 17) [Microdochium nivale]|nr:NET1-associated nuclear protein 1 (U3 small nucleolar RNA-associated protein 17) [Microdochium nivale]